MKKTRGHYKKLYSYNMDTFIGKKTLFQKNYKT